MVTFLSITLLFVASAWIYSIRQARKEKAALEDWYATSVNALYDDYLRQHNEDIHKHGLERADIATVFDRKFEIARNVACMDEDELAQLNKVIEREADYLTGGLPVHMLLEDTDRIWMLYLIEDTQPTKLDMLEMLVNHHIKDITGRALGVGPRSWKVS